MKELIVVLRVIHIVSGVFWVGTTLFLTFYLLPVLGAAGPAAGTVMGGLQRRGLMTVMPVSAVLALASGMGLFQLVSGGSVAAFVGSPVGATFAGAGALALIAFVLGMAASRPAALASARLTQELAVATEAAEREQIQQRLRILQRRNMVVSRIVAVMLIGAAAGMAIARYM